MKADGTVVHWGPDNSGKPPAGLSQVVDIDAGFLHAVAIKTDGTVIAWGDNTYGQTDIPDDLNDVVAISAGYSTNLAVKADGKVVAWGLGATKSTPGSTKSLPYDIGLIPTDLNNVIAVAVGTNHAVALKKDGSLVSWGDNAYGKATVPAGFKALVP